MLSFWNLIQVLLSPLCLIYSLTSRKAATVSAEPSNVKLASPSSSVVVEPIVTNLFAVWLFNAVIVPLPPAANEAEVKCPPSIFKAPNEPVEVDEPLMFPSASMFPPASINTFSLSLAVPNSATVPVLSCRTFNTELVPVDDLLKRA